MMNERRALLCLDLSIRYYLVPEEKRVLEHLIRDPPSEIKRMMQKEHPLNLTDIHSRFLFNGLNILLTLAEF